MGGLLIRPMTPDDAAACTAVWEEAYGAMRAAHHLPAVDPDPEEEARHVRRVALLARSDPGGSWLAEENGSVVGLAQAFVREGLWILSLLGVAVAHQGRGVGRALLERALGYGDRAGPGLILSSPDQRAKRRYVLAGFALHPTVTARGTVTRSALPATGGSVREGGRDDLELVAAVDRRRRGAAHGPELELLLQLGNRLLVAGDSGYALVRDSGVVVLAADDEDTAGLLLTDALARTPPGATVEVNWLTGRQQWAIRRCAELGLELHQGGAAMVRRLPSPFFPYIPSGAYG